MVGKRSSEAYKTACNNQQTLVIGLTNEVGPGDGFLTLGYL
jgi:hypothetical protein